MPGFGQEAYPNLPRVIHTESDMSEFSAKRSVDASVIRSEESASSSITKGDRLVLIPEPSDNPQDPLNWTTFRKARLLLVLCLGAFTGNVAALSGQFAYPLQAELYGVTVLQSSYSVSAAISGLAAGAIFLVPLGTLVGRWSITFWSLLGCLACAVWSARLTHSGDYVQFIVSRLLSGIFGSVPSAIGGGVILDLFFLHNRGRAFICYEISILFGATAGPTFSGFITGSSTWPVCFWWTVPLLAITAVLIFIFAEETGFDRENAVPHREPPKGFLASRWALFFPGTASIRLAPAREIVKTATAPIFIGLSPVTVLCGIFTLIVFGWLLLNDILSASFLQSPVSEGGYGFTPIQNGAFSFCAWFGIIGAQLLGSFVNDGIPLWVCRRYYKGIWRPELRLYVFAISVVLNPVGMGICGAALRNHYHYMVYAFGYFVVAISAMMAAPVATNYVAESFTNYGSECTLVMTFYRLAWGVAIPFFAERWIDEVGIGWVYGIAAFCTLAAWSCILALLWRGPQLRKMSLLKTLVSSEEGKRIFR